MGPSWTLDRYVRVRGEVRDTGRETWRGPRPGGFRRAGLKLHRASANGNHFNLVLPESTGNTTRRADHFEGRVHGVTYLPHSYSSTMVYTVALDAAASRFHGASIAGLVVGAMGVFVFTAALRHWLREQRRFREAAEGA